MQIILIELKWSVQNLTVKMTTRGRSQLDVFYSSENESSGDELEARVDTIKPDTSSARPKTTRVHKPSAKLTDPDNYYHVGASKQYSESECFCHSFDYNCSSIIKLV